MCRFDGCSAWCCVIRILVVIAWWLFASGLLLCAWNSVVARLANVKKAKYWQALVIVLTLVVLFGPLCCGRHAWGRHRDGRGCCIQSGQKGKPCGGCSDWKMPSDSSGHLGR